MAQVALASRYAKDDADTDTKWWKDYPNTYYVERARADKTFDNLVSDIWNKPRRLARSASLTNMTYIRDKPLHYPIHRGPSISSLSPSHALPQYCREAQRIVHTLPVYKPLTQDWYTGPYAKAKFNALHDEITKPYRLVVPTYSANSSHVPYFSFQTKRIFFDEKLKSSRSYIKESQRYLDKYVSARLKADDFANRFAYSAYEWRKPQDHAFNRHFMYNQGVEIPCAPGIPYSFYDKMALRRLYKISGRFYF